MLTGRHGLLFYRFQALLEDAAFAVELLDVEGPAADEGGAIAAQAAAGLQQLEEQLERWQTQRLLSGPYDAQGALLTLTAGAGERRPWRLAEQEGESSWWRLSAVQIPCRWCLMPCVAVSRSYSWCIGMPTDHQQMHLTS
jgi:hypothetical protein